MGACCAETLKERIENLEEQVTEAESAQETAETAKQTAEKGTLKHMSDHYTAWLPKYICSMPTDKLTDSTGNHTCLGAVLIFIQCYADFYNIVHMCRI